MSRTSITSTFFSTRSAPKNVLLYERQLSVCTSGNCFLIMAIDDESLLLSFNFMPYTFAADLPKYFAPSSMRINEYAEFRSVYPQWKIPFTVNTRFCESRLTSLEPLNASIFTLLPMCTPSFCAKSYPSMIEFGWERSKLPPYISHSFANPLSVCMMSGGTARTNDELCLP